MVHKVAFDEEKETTPAEYEEANAKVMGLPRSGLHPPMMGQIINNDTVYKMWAKLNLLYLLKIEVVENIARIMIGK